MCQWRYCAHAFTVFAQIPRTVRVRRLNVLVCVCVSTRVCGIEKDMRAARICIDHMYIQIRIQFDLSCVLVVRI